MVEAAIERTKTALWRRPQVLRLLLIALLAEIGYAVLNISTMPVYLQFDRKFGADVIALVITAFLLSEAVFKSYMGHLADRYGRRRLMVIGPALTIFTSLGTMAVPHELGRLEGLMLGMLRVIDGVGAAMLWPAAFALMSDTVGDRERQESMSLLNTCYLLGIALALPVGGIFNDLFGAYLAQFTGERTPSLYLACLLFVAVTIAAYRNVPTGRVHRDQAAEAKRDRQSSGEHHSDFRDFLDSARRIPEYLILGIVTFAGVGFPMAIVKLFAEQQFGMSETKFGMLVLPGAALMAGLSVPMSKYGERMGRSRAVHVGLGLCAGGLAVICTGAFIPWLRAGWVMALGGMPLGVGFLLAIPAWYASVSEIDPKRRAANIGAVMTAQGLGAIIGAPLGGLFYERFQYFGPDFARYSPFVGCAVCVTAGWILSLRIIGAKSRARGTDTLDVGRLDPAEASFGPETRAHGSSQAMDGRPEGETSQNNG